jgi:Flp pilus assembly protein TadD
MNSRRFRTAVARARRLVEVDARNPENLYLLGEAYRMLGPRSAEPTAAERTDRGQNAARRKVDKRTLDEEDGLLAATPEGAVAMRLSQSRAADCFQKAVELDGTLATPHLGLGALYERLGRKREALAEYSRYLDLAPRGAEDRLRVERRIQALRQ